jgi:molecular chaperone GrpE
LGPETSVDAAEGSSLLTELERLRGREDELLRALAEQQNVVRRRRQEMESSVQYAQESLVKDLLPVLDDFERALKAMDGAVSDSMRAGVALVYERLVRILTAQGLEPIRPLGETFDPTLHDAIAQDPATDQAPGTVVEVAQPGYRFKSRVLRHAKVVVAGSAEPTESSEGGI